MDRLRALLKSTKPVKWLFYGDSITHGAFHTLGWRDYPELFAERVRWELRRMDDVVINTASSGATTRTLVEKFDWRVTQFRPDVVFIMIGMNDCCTGPAGPSVPLPEFEANLVTLAQRVQSVGGALPVLQTTCPLIPGTSPDRGPHLEAYIQMVRTVARRLELPLVDHAAYWQQAAAGQVHIWHTWMSDPIHPNEMGHRVFAELLFKDLRIFDQQACVCRLFHP